MNHLPKIPKDINSFERKPATRNQINALIRDEIPFHENISFDKAGRLLKNRRIEKYNLVKEMRKDFKYEAGR